MKREWPYQISIIMPVYNVEDYVEESILSIINQTLDFTHHIQLIIVNDGSPDCSEEICLKYAEMYPDNIVYIRQENAGVSAARNNGIDHAEGKFIGFLDPDDLWDSDALEKGVSFLETYYYEIDVVGFRIHLFEAVDSYHMLDYKFNDGIDKIVDIYRGFGHVQLSIASAFVKSDVLKQYRFDTSVKIGEDVKMLYPIILQKKRFGLIATACYQYRKRISGQSALQGSAAKEEYYIEMLENVHRYLVDYSLEQFGYVLPYVQYFIAYELKYRVRIKEYPVWMEEKDKQRHHQLLQELLQYVDDWVIGSLYYTGLTDKLNLLYFKYQKPLSEFLHIKEHSFCFRDLLLSRLWRKPVRIDIIELREGTLHVSGYFPELNYMDRNDYSLYFEDQNGNQYPASFVKRPEGSIVSLGTEISEHYEFCVDIPLEGLSALSLIIDTKTEEIKLNLRYGQFGGLTEKVTNSYCELGKYIVTCKLNQLLIRKKSTGALLTSELRIFKPLLAKKKYKTLIIRWLYYILRLFVRKPIWLISDRIVSAKDNGAAFFRYASKKCKEDRIKPYFVLSKSSADYREMKKVGHVIPYGSLRYKLFFLLSDKVISSSGDAWVLNPFGKSQYLYRGLFQFDYVFLQHGIIKDDLSAWLNKYNKNMKMFVTSAKDEYDSIVNGNYQYPQKVIALTGLPRYDYLSNQNRKKTILILPTWRKDLVGGVAADGTRLYNPGFKDSLYFHSYDSLMRHPRLLETLEQYGYEAKFYLHPSLLSQIEDFQGNDKVHIMREDCNYNKELCESSIMITDFSSVAFDFAYLKKPVLYYHFDADTIFENHIYGKGYFEYERDGLGPVCYEADSLVEQIIRIIESHCEPEQEYIERIEKFYYRFDQNNCRRVYDAIMKID